MAWTLLSAGPEATPEGIRFTYYDPTAQQVYLAGDFNNWDPTALPMERDETGLWSVTLRLSPGRHEYKFVVDGQWVADPANPITAGAYGNSVIQVDENGQLVPVLPTSNTPMSSLVYVHGNLIGFLRTDRDTLENRFRLMDTQADLKLDFNVTLELVNLWFRLRYNTRLNLDTLTRLIPVRVERAQATLGTHPRLVTFYNRWVYESPEPFRLVGYEGEFREPFGRDEQGLLFQAQPGPLQTTFLYANQISTDRDLGFLRVQAGQRIALGLSLRLLDGMNRANQAPSPDSLRDDSTGNLIHFNLYDRDWMVALDGTWRLRPTWALQAAWGRGLRQRIAGESDVDGTYSRWERSDLRWTKAQRYRLFFGFRWAPGAHVLRLAWEREHHTYDSLFLPLPHRSVTFTTLHLSDSLEFSRFEFQGSWSRLGIQAPDSLPWWALMEFSGYSRVPYFAWPLVGVNPTHTVEASWRWHLKPQNPSLNLFYRGGLAFAGWRTAPLSAVEVLGLEAQWRKWRWYTEYRRFTLHAPDLEAEGAQNLWYTEIGYHIAPMATLKLSYGLRPWDLNNEYRNRRAFLETQGVNTNLLYTNFQRIGKAMLEAERALAQVHALTLWAELTF